MQRLATRIVLHGALAAALLAVVGVLFGEIAGMWLTAGQASARRATGAAASPPITTGQLPLMMALWGFAFVAAGEVALYFWRGHAQERKAKKVEVKQPDEAERLLEELMSQVEAAQNTQEDKTTT